MLIAFTNPTTKKNKAPNCNDFPWDTLNHAQQTLGLGKMKLPSETDSLLLFFRLTLYRFSLSSSFLFPPMDRNYEAIMFISLVFFLQFHPKICCMLRGECLVPKMVLCVQSGFCAWKSTYATFRLPVSFCPHKPNKGIHRCPLSIYR